MFKCPHHPISSQHIVPYELIFLFSTEALSQHLKFCLPAINCKQLSDNQLMLQNDFNLL